MDKKTKENLLYVAEELRFQYGKRISLFLGVSMLGIGVLWVFHKVDAYLTPPYKPPVVTISAVQATEVIEIKEARIVIPKISAEAPITFVESVHPADFLYPLKNGVAHYPSALPGQDGAAVILGHSAPFGWLGNKYDAIFSDVNDLEQGDTIAVSVNEKEYMYEVSGKTFLEQGDDIPQELQKTDRPRLLLLSCWPPGINNKRIMIQAEII